MNKLAKLSLGIFALTVFSYSTTLSANDDVEVHNFEQMLSSLKLEKIQVEGMIDTMVNSGRLSQDEGQRAKREIASVKDDDLEAIKSQALERLKSKTSLATK